MSALPKAPPARKPRTKPPRKVRLEGLANEVMVITDGEGAAAKEVRYHLSPLAADFGLAFSVRKFTADGGNGTAYDVCLGGGPGNSDICGCKGHLQHGHRTVCRHVAALRALLTHGRV